MQKQVTDLWGRREGCQCRARRCQRGAGGPDQQCAGLPQQAPVGRGHLALSGMMTCHPGLLLTPDQSTHQAQLFTFW